MGLGAVGAVGAAGEVAGPARVCFERRCRPGEDLSCDRSGTLWVAGQGGEAMGMGLEI